MIKSKDLAFTYVLLKNNCWSILIYNEDSKEIIDKNLIAIFDYFILKDKDVECSYSAFNLGYRKN